MPIETSNHLATIRPRPRALPQVARNACQTANQADTDCQALAATLEETHAELERVRAERDEAFETLTQIRAVLS